MKTIEEKAKAYDEALEKAKKLYEKGTITESIGYIFPELEKSEDEKIRKELIEHIKANKWADYVLFQKFSPDDVIAWLEKQGGQKPVISDDALREGIVHFGITQYQIDNWLKKYIDVEKHGNKPQGKSALEAIKEEKADNANKIEPKFHEGEWITNGDYTWKIIEVEPLDYILQSQDGNIVDDTTSHVDEQFHSFTIEDAKDGDVLYSLDSKQPFIFKHRKTHEQAEVYCGINIYGKFFVGNTKDCIITTDKYIPATKEQRDKLLKAMADAGYEWDAEKKELSETFTKRKEARMTDSEYLDKALDFIVEREECHDYICCELHKIPEEEDVCAKECQCLDRQCVLRFLEYYKKGGENDDCH